MTDQLPGASSRSQLTAGQPPNHQTSNGPSAPRIRTGTPQLEVSGLGKRFGDRWAVRDSSFELIEGEFFGLLGPSGCGKSTTLNAVAGFVEPTEGDILIAGTSVLATPPHRRDTAMVFQNYALFPHLSAAANIAFGLRLRRRGRREITERVEELLDLVGLAGKGDQLPDQLSGGEQQRVAVARALAVEPKVILLDEPLSNLDARLRDHMRKELKRILGNGSSTVLFVTHDQGEAFSMCDRVAVMFDGRIQQLDTPSSIYRAPSSLRLAEFIGETNLVACSVTAQHGDTVEVELHVGGGRSRCEILPQDGANPGADGHLIIRPECVRLRRLGSGEPAALAGTVERATFVGPVVQYGVSLGQVAVESWQFSNQAPLEVGAAVAVDWAAPDARFFPGSAT